MVHNESPLAAPAASTHPDDHLDHRPENRHGRGPERDGTVPRRRLQPEARNWRPPLAAAAGWRPTGLWRHPDFVRFWAAHSISQVGSHVSLLALPLAAALALDATPGQMGLLAAAERAPFLVFGLFAGVWVDRRRRRPLMVVADIGRALLLALIPLAAAVDRLGIGLLFAVAVGVGTLTVLFDVAYASYLPTLVRRDQLLEGNAKLEASFSGAQAVGPGLAGILVGLLTAPVAIAADALSFLASAAFLGRIRATEPAPEPHPELRARRVLGEIGEGLGVVWQDSRLRALTACGAQMALFGYAFLAIYVLYMSRELGLSPAAIGAVLASGGVGAFGGALLAGPAARRLGVGPAIIWAQVVFALAGATVPLAVLIRPLAVPMLVASETLQYGALAIYTINQISLRQAIAPERVLGRVTATNRFLGTGSAALGSLLGGALGGWIGLGWTLIVTIVGMGLAAVWVAASPLRGVREVPAPHDA